MIEVDSTVTNQAGAQSGVQDPAEEVSKKLQESSEIKRVAIAQITTDPGRIKENVEKIIATIEQAREQGVDLVVFPELTVSGYSHMDLAFNREFLKDNKKAIELIAPHTEGMTVILGFLNENEEKEAPGGKPFLHNSAAVMHDGELVHDQDKSLLPNYGVFSEMRYFQPAEDRKVVQIGDKKIGVMICEDIWRKGYDTDVPAELVEQGADLLVSLNASPFHTGRIEERKAQLSQIAQKHETPMLYANLVGSFDGFDAEVVFDGRSMIVDENGSLQAMAKGFSEDLLVFDLHQPKQMPIPQVDDIHELHDALVLGIRDYFRRQGFERAYIGLSGGVDSALVAALAVEALGPENVIGVTMPSHITGSDTLADAYGLAENLGIKIIERSIVEEYRAWERSFMEANGEEPQKTTKENKQARIRGSILMEYTNEDRGSLLISTGNKTELAVGYCTLYGDMCGGFAAISDVNKLEVYDLCNFINLKERREIIPKGTIERPPAAELSEDQTDADNLPADYPVLAPLVDEIVEGNATPDELCERYSPKVVMDTLRLVHLNEYKRRQASPGVRVSKRAFGIERRVPMAHKYYGSVYQSEHSDVDGD